MSARQQTYLDFKNLGDQDTNTAGAVQPFELGEAASPVVLNRSPENLRSRTEIARQAIEDLFYYRDRTSRYLIELGSGGTLAWSSGTGIVNNTAALVLRPFIGVQTNVKGLLTIGTAASNQLLYTVAATAYATDGMNAITVEHRNVPGTSPAVVTISAGPVYRILVVFDSTNTGHDATTIAGLVNAQIAGVAALTGKLSVTTNAVPATAILATSGEVPINTRTHGAGTGGNATADVEAHTLASGALGTFTTTNPLADGDLIAIRYDYLVEPGSVSDDPKGGVAGGRAESNQARSNSDVSANLFIAQDHPEWLPGCIPLAKRHGTTLFFVDGTAVATNTSVVPGSGLGTYVNPAVFHGVPTQANNGGIDNSGDPIIQDLLVSFDSRLGDLRSATWTVSDGTNSQWGSFNSATGLQDAVNASGNGGDIVLRRGVYSPGLPTIALSQGSLSVRGETHDGTLTGRTRVTAVANTTVTGSVSLDNLAYLRTGAFTTTLLGTARLSRVAFQAGALTIGGGSGQVHLSDCVMYNTVSTGNHSEGGLTLSGENIHATNCRFLGADPLAGSAVGAVWQGNNTVRALYENCEFWSNNAAVQPFAFEQGTTQTTFVNCTFTMSGQASAFALDLNGADLGCKVTFRGCRFTNNTGFAVARVTPISGQAIFEGCHFEGTGSPNGLAVSYQSVLTLCPDDSAGRVTLRDCTSRLTATNFTGITRPVYRLGDDEAIGATQGTLEIDGLDITIAGATTTLPPSAVVRMQGTARCLLQRIEVDVSGKRAPDVTNSTPNGGPGYVFLGTGDASRLQLRDLVVRNANAPLTTALGTCVSGWFRLELCDLLGARVLPTSSPSSNSFTNPVVHLIGSTMRDATLYGFVQGGSQNPILLTVSGAAPIRSVLENATLLSATPANTAWGIDSIVTLSGGICKRLRVGQAVSYEALTAVFTFASGATAASEIHECDIVVVQTSCGAFVQVNAGGARNCVVMNNRFRSNNTGGISPGTVLFSGGHVGLQMIGNKFTTNGDAAVNSTPNPTTVVATAATNVSNNTFDVALSTPA